MIIDYSTFTPKSRDIIANAEQIAHEYGRYNIEALDLFLAVLVSKDIPILTLFEQKTGSAPDFIHECGEYTSKLKKKNKNDDYFWTNEAESIIEGALSYSEELQEYAVMPSHFLLSLLNNSNQVKKFVKSKGLDSDDLRDTFLNSLVSYINNSRTSEEEKIKGELERAASGSPNHGNLNQGKMGGEDNSNVGSFCRDISEEVKENSENFSFFGREQEIKRMVVALSRKQKSNILLVGEAGTGKTALVKGLAQTIIYPPPHINIAVPPMDIFELKLSEMVAGTKFRGDFEEKITKTLDEVKERKTKTVLFIDEFHTIVGAGGGDGPMDAANIIKPSLVDGSLSCIGATTYEEYKRYIEKDPALSRRFEVIHVNQPSKQETLELLNKCKDVYQKFHKVHMTEESIKTILDFADKYIPYRNFPDKAFDLLDETSAYIRLKELNKPEEVKFAEEKIRELVKKSEEEANNDELALAFEEYNRIFDNWVKSLPQEAEAKPEEVRDFLVNKFQVDESKDDRYKQVSKILVGNESKIKKICSAIDFYQQIPRSQKPSVSLLLSGPSGVGKTILAEQIAKTMPMGESSLIYLNMANYSSASSVSTLLGSSVGYIGSEKGGVLTEKLKNNPTAVLFLKNIDKANDSVLNVLSAMMEKGYIEDGIGSRIDCSRVLVIASIREKHNRSAGFTMGSDTDREKELEMNIPESLSRLFDHTTFFDPLSREEYKKIAKIESEKIISNFPNLEFLSDEIIDKALENANTDKCGAKNISSEIEKIILEKFSENMS